MEQLTGRLIVASHDLTDPSFRRTVVLILAHDGDAGAAGVVLNRPGPSAPPPRLAHWSGLLAPPGVLFRGGPVGADTVIGIATGETDVDLTGWQPISDPVGVIDLGGDADLARAQLRSLRLFVGYAGWTEGQLEREIAAGAWFVVDGDPADPFTPTPDGLWRAVLARQGGLFTTVPDDPALN